MNTAEKLMSAFMGGHPAFRVARSTRRMTWGPYTMEALQNHTGVSRMTRGNGRWRGHTGAKERARYAGWPDGVMHAVPPIHERNAQAALPKARKPRAPRAKP